MILFLGLLILLGGNCTKNPTGPIHRRGYTLYTVATNKPYNIYFIDTAIDKVVDSIPFNNDIRINVSEDGNLLLAAEYVYEVQPPNYEPNFYYLYHYIDTETKRILYTNREGGLQISPDNRYVFSSLPPAFKVYRTFSSVPIFEDSTLSIHSITFDEKKQLAYGELLRKDRQTIGEIGVFDYRRLMWVDTFTIASIDGDQTQYTQLQLSKDGRRLYFEGIGVFGVYDVVAGQVVFWSDINAYTGGYFALTPDERYAYITDPAAGPDCPYCPPPSGQIQIYDSWQNLMIEPISVDTFACEGCAFPPFTYNVAASPDNQNVYVEVMFDYILVIDTNTRQIINTIAPREPSGVSQLKIQRKPWKF